MTAARPGTPNSGVPGSPTLAGLARDALAHYGLEGAELLALRQGNNTVYRADAHGESYVLRLHTAARHGVGALASELLWLDYLSGAAQLPVPRPIRARAGGWVVEVGDEPTVLCTLLSWEDGESLPEGASFTAPQARLAGELLARLHLAAEHFAAEHFGVPQDFERPSYDPAYFLGCWTDLRSSLAEHVCAGRLAAMQAGLNGTLAPWRQGTGTALPGGLGLIHADPHPGNFLRQGESLCLLDFDRCGWGPFLLDVAHASLDLEPAERGALLAGYLQLRALPPDSREFLRALRLLAAVENLAFLARRPHELPFVLGALPSLEEALLGGRPEPGAGRG